MVRIYRALPLSFFELTHNTSLVLPLQNADRLSTPSSPLYGQNHISLTHLPHRLLNKPQTKEFQYLSTISWEVLLVHPQNGHENVAQARMDETAVRRRVPDWGTMPAFRGTARHKELGEAPSSSLESSLLEGWMVMRCLWGPWGWGCQ